MFRASPVRAAALAVALVGGSACSLVLEDPAPFAAETSDAGGDAAPRDAAPDTAEPNVTPDVGRPPDRPAPDAAPPRDAAPRDAVPDGPPADAAPVDAAPPAPDACRPAPEVCNGTDDDCDGRIDDGIDAVEVCNGADDDCDDLVDESDPGRCEPCGPRDATGVCGVGAFLCVEGRLVCVPWLPAPGPAVDCDLFDNDCDGLVDEADEEVPARSALEARVIEECGPRDDAEPPPPGDGCSLDPRVVGCAPVHACVDPNCRLNCHDNHALDVSLCESDGDDVAAALRRLECRAAARAAFEACLGDCAEAIDPGSSRWACHGGDGGPVCEAIDCPEGTVPEGPRCVPR